MLFLLCIFCIYIYVKEIFWWGCCISSACNVFRYMQLNEELIQRPFYIRILLRPLSAFGSSAVTRTGSQYINISTCSSHLRSFIISPQTFFKCTTKLKYLVPLLWCKLETRNCSQKEIQYQICFNWSKKEWCNCIVLLIALTNFLASQHWKCGCCGQRWG